MTLKEKLAKKMLDGKFNHLGLEDSLELYLSGVVIKVDGYWVYNCEEVCGDDWDLEFRGTMESFEEIKKEMIKVYGDSNHFEIGNSYDHFSEFTRAVCPAPTYMDLIR